MFTEEQILSQFKEKGVFKKGIFQITSMKKLSKQELHRILNSIPFFDYKNYGTRGKGKLLIISLKNENKGDSAFYNFSSREYLNVENKLKELFSYMINFLLKKQLLIKVGYKNSWLTPGEKKVFEKEKRYFKYLNFLEKLKIPLYFEGGVFFLKKEIDFALLKLLVEMNIRNRGDFDFIFDNNFVLSINHHMEFFLFFKDHKDINILRKLLKNNPEIKIRNDFITKIK